MFSVLTPTFTFVPRLILTTVLVTSKMFNDTYYTNQYIASFGGVTLRNMNELEAFFMQMIDWRLNIQEDEFINVELRPTPVRSMVSVKE